MRKTILCKYCGKKFVSQYHRTFCSQECHDLESLSRTDKKWFDTELKLRRMKKESMQKRLEERDRKYAEQFPNAGPKEAHWKSKGDEFGTYVRRFY